jgi:hypothetical protein
MANQFGTFPLAAGGALVMQIPSAVYQLALGLAAIPLMVLLARERSTKITAAGITIRGARSRFIPWDQVDAITVDGDDGDDDRAIIVRLLDGSRLRLPDPVERHRRTRDPEFDAKYSAIVAAWLRRRIPISGPGDEPGGSSAPGPAGAQLVVAAGITEPLNVVSMYFLTSSDVSRVASFFTAGSFSWPFFTTRMLT